jgi:hypothetical protein
MMLRRKPRPDKAREPTIDNPVTRGLRRESVTEVANVTLKGSEEGRKHYSDAELSEALELINQEVAPFFRPDPLDISNARRDERAYAGALDRVSALCIENTGRLMALLNPYVLYTKAPKELAERRAKVANDWADLFHALEIMLREQWSRFRGCAICSRLFLPRRHDQKCCSKGCAGVLRIRRHRAKQAEYEYNRKLKSAGVKPARESVNPKATDKGARS